MVYGYQQLLRDLSGALTLLGRTTLLDLHIPLIGASFLVGGRALIAVAPAARQGSRFHARHLETLPEQPRYLQAFSASRQFELESERHGSASTAAS